MSSARTRAIQTPGAKTIHGAGGKVTASSFTQVGGRVDGRLAGQPLGRPPRDPEHAERRDERHDAQARDGEAVHEADERRR